MKRLAFSGYVEYDTNDRWAPQAGMSYKLSHYLSTTALCAGGMFFIRGWRSIVNRSLNMFTLIMLGVGTAYAYSVVAVVFPGIFPNAFRSHGGVALYFEAAAVVTTLILLGQWLEARARRQTGEAVQSLLGLLWPGARWPMPSWWQCPC